MKNSDYLIGIHGAGLALSIFLPKSAIYHELLKSPMNNLLTTMSSMSGHITYSDIIKAESHSYDGNTYISFDENSFSKSVLAHMKENNFL